MQPVDISIVQTEKYKAPREFFSFFLTALLGASINFVSRFLYREFFAIDFSTSVLFGYLTATVLTFIPTKKYAFAAGNTGNTKREAIKFLIIAGVALAVQVYVAKFTLEYIANPLFPNLDKIWREAGSHVVGMGLSFLANFFGHKLLTFRSTGVYDRIKSRTNRQDQDMY
ncbi:GtrA family protein [Fibrella sp. HMF5335]|uniref:GtrA family protein n=1 Tax=Fibrella rubiginis TaxID=2817060 RepID=A0A939GKF2_9BACT|nr:GtrA family protein [Fibrella rubiginis]MBO0938058.1 GtrA family protein [Fibrella rubiginis]